MKNGIGWRSSGTSGSLVGSPKAERVRHDPIARYITDQLGNEGTDLYQVLSELRRLKDLGIPITMDIVNRIIMLRQSTDALVRMGVFVKPEVKEPKPYAPRPGAPKGRFNEIKTQGSVVYYARIGNRVKIGTSTNLAERMRTINPEELMAAEVGDLGTERYRHKQFEHLRTHGEWFKLQGDLARHIKQLKSQHPKKG